MNKNWFGVALSFITGMVLPADAADISWLGVTAGWKDVGNWTAAGGAWSDGLSTIFNNDSAIRDVNVNGNVSPSRLSIRGDYRFFGTGTITLNELFIVDSGMTATIEAPFAQTATAKGSRLQKHGEGSLVLKSGMATNSVYRFSQHVGTMRLDGGTLEVTGTSTSASADEVVASFVGGDFVVDGGALFRIKNTTSFLSNTGAGVFVTNGTFDAWNVGEFLNGFDFDASSRTRSFITVADKGVLIGKKVRVGKIPVASFESYPEYGRINVRNGGVVRVREWNIDNKSYAGQINFDGGIWEMASNDGESTGTEFAPFGSGDADGNARWSGLVLSIGKGGATIKSLNGMKRKLTKKFVAGDENDGGLRIVGSSGCLLYMNATNEYAGGTWLQGGGGTYIPRDDRAFGAVPGVPTNNIFVTESDLVLHTDTAMDIHPNRNVLISPSKELRVGNSAKMRVCGQVAGAATSSVRVMDTWNGSLALAPDNNRTNEVGRLVVEGRMVIEDGVTRLTATGSQVGWGKSVVSIGKDTGKTAPTGFEDNKRVFEVSGGRVEIANNEYIYLGGYSRLKVNGGVLDATATKEVLNGMDAPSEVEIGNGGVLEANVLRVSQWTGAPGSGQLAATRVHVATGGVLKVKQLTIDASKARYGRLDLDGGTVVCRETRSDGNFLGNGNANWAGIQVRACEGGAIFDTAGFYNDVKKAIVSGAAKDGGITKKGAGTLVLRGGQNTYNGKTRVDDGMLQFLDENGFPGGDLEVSVAAVKDNARTTELIRAKKLVFNAGAKIRVVDAEGIDAETFGEKIILARTEQAMTSVPQVMLVDKNGVEHENPNWKATLSANGMTLMFGAKRGMMLIVR